MKIQEILNSIPSLPQAQFSLIDQLWNLALIADKIKFNNAFRYLHNMCYIKADIRFEMKDIINNISVLAEDCKFVQSSVKEQLKILSNFAIKLGLYDANDFIKSVVG